MKMMNLGCGPDIKEGWLNVDFDNRLPTRLATKDVDIWDARYMKVPNPYKDFDLVLINHVLCTMDYNDVDRLLNNIYQILKPGGKLQVIDMDLMLAFGYYSNGEEDLIPASGKNIDYKFVNHISGFGTRKSLYMAEMLKDLLLVHGFTEAYDVPYSEHDLRPNESLIVEAVK